VGIIVLAVSASLFVFIALLLGLIGVRQMSPGKTGAERRVHALRSQTGPAKEAVILRQISAIPALRSFLTDNAWAERTSLDLERANLHLRVGEYLLARVFLAILFTFFGLLIVGFRTQGLLLAIPMGILGFMLPAFYLGLRKGRRQQAIQRQLVEAITLIANSLRSGFGFLQGVQAAAQQLTPPIADELDHLVQDISLGVSTEQALADMGRRVGSQDLDIAITAIIVQRSTGGNLSEILDSVAETMRERERVQGEISTLTAEKRLSGNVLAVYPAVLAAILFLIQPDVMSTLWTSSTGIMLLVIAGVLQLIGFIAIRKIVTIDI
jgi:tight adherence protein B